MSGRSPASGGPPAHVMAARRRGELVVSAEAVARAVDRVSVRLSLDLAEADPLVLSVMHGALPFAGMLLPRLNFPLEVGFVHVGRYRDATRGGRLEWHAAPRYRLEGRTVLLLDDVLDRGETLAALTAWAREGGAARVAIAVLVDKQVDHDRAVQADYVGIECPDRYLFGCGMDYQGYWRNLPAIYALPTDMESP